MVKIAKRTEGSFIIQVLAELRYGLLSGWYRFILPFVFGLIYADSFIRHIRTYVSISNIDLQVSFMDCIIYVFKGMKEITPSNPFELPVQYSFIILMLALFIGSYPLKNLHDFGKNILIRSRRKSDWWFSKCIWNISMVMAFFVSIYAGAGFRCILTGSMFCGIGDVSADAIGIILGCNKDNIYDTELMTIMAIILPILTGIALSLFEMMMAFLTSPVISYISIITIAIFSAYYTKWFMPGNFLMSYRYVQACNNGITLMTSVVVDVVIIVASIVIGKIYFNRCDVL